MEFEKKNKIFNSEKVFLVGAFPKRKVADYYSG